jgi:hypothetical protein
MKLSPLARFAVLALTLAVSAQAAPKTFHEHGVSFTYDDAELSQPKARRVKAVILTDPSDKPDGVAPAHVVIDFAEDRGHLWIYPTADSAVKNFAKAFPTIDDAHRDLVKVLQEHPAERKEMPVMPWADVGVGFTKKIRYLDFRNGSGVAWLTQWMIDTDPINNAESWYVFQGLTRDGAYYVSAQIHVAHPSLPATGEMKNPEAFEKGYAAYLKKAVPAIAKQPDESFRPSLAALRALFESIEVSGK